MELHEAINLIATNMPHNNFAQSLAGQYARRGTLSDKQRFWAFKLAADVVAAESEPDFGDLSGLWGVMPEKGELRAILQDQVLAVRRPSTSRPALYAKLNGGYLGSVSVDGGFRLSRDGAASVSGSPELERIIRELFQMIIADPHGSLVAYGRETGTCGVCGRTLTDPVSIERGIGPICEGRLR